MVPVDDLSRSALQERFIREAEELGCTVTTFANAHEGIEHILHIIAPDQTIQSWDLAHIPLPQLDDALANAEIRIVSNDPTVRVGVTGVDAALAGTGSLILATGPGKPRQASLVPPVHIAVITNDQIIPNLDVWIAGQRTNEYHFLRRASTTVMISGPSRTGDIANVPVKGVHGPGTVHIIIV